MFIFTMIPIFLYYTSDDVSGLLIAPSYSASYVKTDAKLDNSTTELTSANVSTASSNHTGVGGLGTRTFSDSVSKPSPKPSAIETKLSSTVEVGKLNHSTINPSQPVVSRSRSSTDYVPMGKDNSSSGIVERKSTYRESGKSRPPSHNKTAHTPGIHHVSTKRVESDIPSQTTIVRTPGIPLLPTKSAETISQPQTRIAHSTGVHSTYTDISKRSLPSHTKTIQTPVIQSVSSIVKTGPPSQTKAVHPPVTTPKPTSVPIGTPLKTKAVHPPVTTTTVPRPTIPKDYCLNGGTAVILGEKKYGCVCSGNHYGQHCENATDEPIPHLFTYLTIGLGASTALLLFCLLCMLCCRGRRDLAKNLDYSKELDDFIISNKRASVITDFDYPNGKC